MASEVTAQTFEDEVLARAQPVIVDFWAPWCGPCRAIAPVLERIAAEREGELSLVKVNIDAEPALAACYGVSSIPTVMLFANGGPVATTVGAKAKAQMERELGLPPEEANPEGEGKTPLLSRVSAYLRRGDRTPSNPPGA